MHLGLLSFLWIKPNNFIQGCDSHNLSTIQNEKRRNRKDSPCIFIHFIITFLERSWCLISFSSAQRVLILSSSNFLNKCLFSLLYLKKLTVKFWVSYCSLWFKFEFRFLCLLSSSIFSWVLRSWVWKVNDILFKQYDPGLRLKIVNKQFFESEYFQIKKK